MNPEHAKNVLFFSLLLGVSFLFLFLLRPFFFPLFWAAVLATLFLPLHDRLLRKNLSPSLSASVVLLVILLVLILPAGIIGSLLVTESLDLYNAMDAESAHYEEKVRSWLASLSESSLLTKFKMDAATLTDRVTDGAKNIAGYVFSSLKDLTQNTLIFLIQFLIMLYTLFFFIRDGRTFLQRLVCLSPLDNDMERILFQRFTITARATLKVTLLIGGIQGLLGGLLFLFLGMKGALTWGVVMVFAAIIPGVGCSIIWVPAGVLMLLSGHVWQGALIFAYGVMVISMVDNFLRPLILGKDVQMHPLLIFLSTIGGIAFFGLSGFVLGPILASLLLAFWDLYEDYCVAKSGQGSEGA